MNPWPSLSPSYHFCRIFRVVLEEGFSCILADSWKAWFSFFSLSQQNYLSFYWLLSSQYLEKGNWFFCKQWEEHNCLQWPPAEKTGRGYLCCFCLMFLNKCFWYLIDYFFKKNCVWYLFVLFYICVKTTFVDFEEFFGFLTFVWNK